MAGPHEGFSIELAKWEGGRPADRARGCADCAGESEQFAGVLLGAVLAMRAQEGVWGNGEHFGGTDLAETAARFLLAVAEREQRAGGYWHFAEPGQAEREGYADRLAKLRRLAEAAREYVESVGKK